MAVEPQTRASTLTPVRRAAIEMLAARNPHTPQARAIRDLLAELDRITRPQPCPLTKRQKQVLVDAANGETYRASGEHLGLRPHTVRTYRRRIHQQLGVGTIAQAVAVAMAYGWIGRSHIHIPGDAR